MTTPSTTSKMTRFGWTFAITSLAWFMFALDRLVVTTALPAIRSDLGTGLAGTEWAVNAYTLTFAVLLLTGAALGDRFGRRRVFTIGLAVFTAGSAGAALAPSIAVLVTARAVQGVGGALFAPLAMTLLSAQTRPERRGAVLGAWGAIGGLGAAAGPLLAGGVTDWVGWPWVFWLNVPIGVGLAVLAPRRLVESRGGHRREPLDLPGVALVSAGLLGVVWGLVEAGGAGWSAPDVPVAVAGGAVALVLFVVWELRTRAPMLQVRLFARRSFAAVNAVSLLMYAALFGSLFLVAQLLQTGLGATALEAGLRMLPMVLMPMLLAPVGGLLSDRWGTRPLLGLGVGMVAVGLGWLALVVGPGVGYLPLVPGMVLLGAGSGLYFAPVAAAVLAAVGPAEQGQASGVATAVRELGVVVGVAVLASVFAAHGDQGSAAGFLAGVRPALWLGAGLGAAGVLVAFALPGRPVGCGSPQEPVRA
jgi:EmrB/QacA subfamily drug resistance transporter